MYEKYYSLKKDVIIEGLIRWRHESKRVAIWGAGRRGKEFLMLYDSEKKYVDYVFDIDLNKLGYILPSGHKVCDYRSTETDVVLFIDPIYTNESVLEFSTVNECASFCCIENVIFGDMSLQESTKTKLIQYRKGHAEIYALTILYNPGDSVIDNIRTYLPFVRQLYLYDNSPNANTDMFDDIRRDPRVIYVWNDGNNYGIGKPINEIAQKLPINSCSWLITFDQDSKACHDMILEMRDYIESDIYDEKIAIVAPLAKNLFTNNYHEKRFKHLPYLTYKQEINSYIFSLFKYASFVQTIIFAFST